MAWKIYKRHYSAEQKQGTINRLRKAGYDEGREWMRQETDGKTTEFYLREDLERPEDIPKTPKPWLVRAMVDGEEVEDEYAARRRDHAGAYFRMDREWWGHEVQIIEVREAA